MTTATLVSAQGFPRPAPAHQEAQRLFWAAFDTGLAFLIIVAAGDIPNRYGVTSLLWMGIYGLTVIRVLLVWPAFYQVVMRNWTYLLYPAVCAMSVVWSLDQKWSLVASIQLTMTVLCGLFIGWRFAPRRMVMIWLAATLLGTVGSLISWKTGGALGRPLYSETGGLLGIYTNKNMLGQFSLFASVLLLGVMMMPKVSALGRVFALAMWVCCALAVVLSKSMTAVVLLPVITGIVLLLARSSLPRWLTLPAVALAVLSIALVPLVLSLLNIDPLDELFRATGKSSNLTGRTDIWAVALSVVERYPLFGVGYGAFWSTDLFVAERYAILQAGATAPTMHNMVLEIMVATGMLGVLAMAALLLTTITRAARWYLATRSGLSAAVLGATVLPVMVAMVEPFLYRQHELPLVWMVSIGTSLCFHSFRSEGQR